MISQTTFFHWKWSRTLNFMNFVKLSLLSINRRRGKKQMKKRERKKCLGRKNDLLKLRIDRSWWFCSSCENVANKFCDCFIFFVTNSHAEKLMIQLFRHNISQRSDFIVFFLSHKKNSSNEFSFSEQKEVNKEVWKWRITNYQNQFWSESKYLFIF